MLPADGQAAFPGENGQFVYADVIKTGSCQVKIDCFAERVRFFSPQTGRGRTFPTPPDCRDCDDDDPTWSPSGKAVAFLRSPFGSDGATVVAYPGGRIDSARSIGAEPAWSPDGEHFASATQRVSARCCGATETDIYTWTLAGSLERRLTFQGGRSPRWSVRGVIVFARRGRRPDADLGYPITELYTVRSSGGKARRITFGGGDSPDWSPDGRRLVAVRRYFGRGRPQEEEIVIINPRTGKVRRLTYKCGILPVWSPDGKRIAFVRDQRIISLRLRDGAKQVFRVKAENIGYLDWQARPTQ